MKSAIEWGAIIQDPGSEYTSFDEIAKAIQDDATSTLKAKLAEVEAVLEWCDKNVDMVMAPIDEFDTWTASVHHQAENKRFDAPTLYEALRSAWEGREK